MKKAIITLILGLAVIFTIIAFKNNVKQDVPATRENLVGSYRLTEVTTSEGGKPEHSIYNLYLNDCEKDDILKLNPDFSFARIDDGNTCDPLGMESADWALPGNNNIEIEGSLGTISKFDGNTLIVVIDDNNASSNLKVTMTYSKF